jgi:uncharacterized membrane protein
MTLLPSEWLSRRRRLAEQVRRAARPLGSRAAIAAQVGRSMPLRSTAALAVIGLAAALAASPKARQAARRSISKISGTLRRA